MLPSRSLIFKILLISVLLVPAALIAYKLFFLHYPLSALIPQASYRVDLSMQVDGHGEDIEISTFLPNSDARQLISEEQNMPGPFALNLIPDSLNRVASWRARELKGRHTILYTFSVQPQHIRYAVPEEMPIPSNYAESLAPYLAPTEGIQAGDPLIVETLQQALAEPAPGILEAITAIYTYTRDDLANRNFAGYTDALTALKLGEASCNGKGRLFVAMARTLKLPSRLVGGLILEQGAKRITHQWVEVFINGHWVPFDPLNDHFAEIPANYLTLYYGDQVLFRRTANVNFQYFFKMTKRLLPRPPSQTVIKASALDLMNMYTLFGKVGISQNLLKIILMLPLGALMVTILRNVIGLDTFGTFLPALIAAAARETGFWWGMTGFLAIILIAVLVHMGLDHLRLLHTPKMAIMLTVVIIVMLLTSALSVEFGYVELAHVTLFPIAILAITAERFALVQTEQGLRQALKLLLTTLLAVGACFAVMDSLFFQSMVLVFPELLLVGIGLNLWLGKWIGIRASEFVRFRHLIKEGRS